MEDLIECEYCSRIWDGNAQCPCRMYDSSDEESEEIDVYTEWLQDNGDIPNDLNTIWVSDRVSDENIIWNELGSLGYCLSLCGKKNVPTKRPLLFNPSVINPSLTLSK